MSSEIIKKTLSPSSPLVDNFRDSLRRHFVDDFYMKKIPLLPSWGKVLDLGGNKQKKRGLFNINDYSLDVIYVNFSAKQRPDVQADGCYLPFGDEIFDGVICAELLEHVRDPLVVLREVHRVLRPGATLLVTVPFMFPIHADPYDYGRYTDQFWLESLSEYNFTDIIIEWQGGFWCVFADMLRGFGMEKEERSAGTKEKIINWMNVHLQKSLKRKALKMDSRENLLQTFFMKGCTTGFGISCRKEDEFFVSASLTSE